MALDWIKFRGELFSHPRFISLCSALVYDAERPGMLLYVCGADALDIGVMPPAETTITERALRIVTEDALRDVTMSALLRVWCAVNSHCKVDENDAVMQPMALMDLDRIAGFAGFGDAILEVGWVKERGRNSLVFPNFLEFNEPACCRKPPKTNAERQRDFRARKPVSTPVTKSNGCNDREEKRREEKKKDPPNPPAGGIDTFDTFWNRYPRKENKPKAIEAWKKLEPDAALAARILEAIDRQQRHGCLEPRSAADGRSVIPHASTWLNNRRWEDEPPKNGKLAKPLFETQDDRNMREMEDALNFAKEQQRERDSAPRAVIGGSPEPVEAPAR